MKSYGKLFTVIAIFAFAVVLTFYGRAWAPTPYCGDRIVGNTPGETCDPPGEPGPGEQPGTCRDNCTYCGDGFLDPNEDCDDGNGIDGDGCDNDCTDTPTQGDEGCTPGYWKQEQHFDSWVGYVPGYPGDDPEPSLFSDAFGDLIEWILWKDPEERGKPQWIGGEEEDDDFTLLQALEANGGGDNELARHAAAALLSLTNPDVAYPLSWDEILAAVTNGNAEILVEANELGCPLNGDLSDDMESDQLRDIAACGTTVSGPGNPKAINLGCLVMVLGAVVLWRRSGRRS